MTPMTLKYPEDWSGTLPSNHITGEKHTVPRVKNKCFALDGGPFFTGSLVITEAITGKVLVRGTDYKPLFLYQDASIYAGQEVCAAIAIINDAVSGDLLVDYQIIGGTYVSLIDALYQAITALQLDDRSIDWDDIKNKPELYPPEPHIHHVSALYGTEHMCMAIYALKQAILTGDAAGHERIWASIDLLRADMIAGDATVTALAYAHINRIDNPHQTTKAQVGLGNVQNYQTATQAQAEAGTAADRYMTAQTVGWAVNKIGGDLVAAHANRVDNPHKVTKAQVNLGIVENFGIATDNEAITGIATNKYMTPYLTKLAIDKIAGDQLKAHVADKSNPHETTQAQVGLGNVMNYGMATDPEAVAGLVSNKYMHPANVKAAITAQAVTPLTALLTAHTSNMANPHGTTKAQVGLGNVDNFLTATQPQAEAGADNSTFVTPLRSRQGTIRYVNDSVMPTINNHINNRNNPHGVTKAQVGLGSVNNYGTASIAEAENTGSNSVYMTPWSTGYEVRAIINATVVPTTNSLQAQINAINTRLNSMAATNQVIASGNASMGGLTPGGRYLIWMDGVVNHGGTKGWVTMARARCLDSNSGAVLDETWDRWIDNPDGNAPYGAMLVITAPASGAVTCYVDGTTWFIVRTMAIRVG